MKPIKRRRFVSLLLKEFFVKYIREGKGSHALYSSPSILKQLDIDYNEFMARFRN